jgi:hypothetical protein
LKRLLYILLLLITAKLNATTYYVKVGGSMVSDGLSDATAWDIQKINNSPFFTFEAVG